MTMRTDFAEEAGLSGGFGFLPYLRIAIPSWRVSRQAQPAPAPASLSREEIAALFDGELRETRRRRRKLTAQETSEQELASKIRSALYSA